MRTMKWVLALAFGVFGAIVLAFVSGPARKPKTEPLSVAEIKLFPTQSQGPISPLIYGASVEWTENGNRIFDPARGQLRPEIIDLLKPLHIPVWRFPGGILSDYYHWRDGVGPRDKRPKRANPMDESMHESSFGTDEFIDFCKALDAEPLVTANFGTGSLQETLEWQKYFLERGLPVKFWEIGNEIYLAEPKEHASVPGNDRRIYKTVQQYSSGFRDWANALRTAEPRSKVGAIAGTYNTSTQNAGWLSALMSGAGSDVDFIALHDAFAPLIFGRYDYNNQTKREEAYQAMFAQAMFAADDIRRVSQSAASFHSPPSQIAITEHFPLFGGTPNQLMAILDQSRTLASALYTASLFHAFMRERVWMANYNIAVSKWFGALLTDTDQGIVKTPTYYLYDLYRNHFGDTLINVQATSPLFVTKEVGVVKPRSDVAYLDVVASRREGSIYLAVINRNLAQPVQARISIDGISPDAIAELISLEGPAPNAINGTSLSQSTQGGSPDVVRLKNSSWKGVNSGTYTFPSASVTIFEWKSESLAEGK